MARGVRGAILIGILLTTVVSFFMGIKALPTGIGDIFGMPVSLARLPYSWI